MIINVIHLWERKDRWEGWLKEAETQGFEYKMWPGIEYPLDRKAGIYEAHSNIVRAAKEHGEKMVCIAEDDCRFFLPGAWQYFLDNIPEDFDVYFGMIYVGKIENNRIRGNEFSGMTMYIVHERFYDAFLSLPTSCHLDRELALSAEQNKYIVCDQFVCEQDGSKSDHNRTTCNYRPFLVGRKIFMDMKL